MASARLSHQTCFTVEWKRGGRELKTFAEGTIFHGDLNSVGRFVVTTKTYRIEMSAELLEISKEPVVGD